MAPTEKREQVAAAAKAEKEAQRAALRAERCKVVALNKANKTTLAEKIAKIGEDCTDELKFATKHGLDAFRDHRAILEVAIEEAVARAVEEARSDQQ